MPIEGRRPSAYWLNLYPVAILFEPHLIHTSRRYAKGKWFNRIFALIFKDIITLELINRYQIHHSTIVIVKLTELWGRFMEPTVRVIDHNYFSEDIDSMWTGCFTTRKALAEEYGTVPMYITHSPVSPQVQGTPDLYYKEEIRNLNLHHDKNGAADMQN